MKIERLVRLALPSVMNIAILIGIVTFLGTSAYLLASVDPSCADNPHATLIYKSDSSIDTLKVFERKFISADTRINIDDLNKTTFINQHPALLTWITAHSIALSLGVTAILFLGFLLYQMVAKYDLLKPFFKDVGSVFSLVITLAVSIAFILLAGGPRKIVMDGSGVMDLFNIIFRDAKSTVEVLMIPYAVLSLILLLGLLGINFASFRVLGNRSEHDADHKRDDYFFLKDRLNLFALFSGLMVATAVITSKLHRNILVEEIMNVDLIYPESILTSYGLYFTQLLALFFIPTLLHLKYYKRKSNFQADQRTNKVLWWDVSKDSVEDVKLIFAVLLPIFSGLIQQLF